MLHRADHLSQAEFVILLASASLLPKTVISYSLFEEVLSFARMHPTVCFIIPCQMQRLEATNKLHFRRLAIRCRYLGG